MSEPETLYFQGIPFVLDDRVPSDVMLIIAPDGTFEIYSVGSYPPPLRRIKQEEFER
jgi:hypothetical protein